MTVLALAVGGLTLLAVRGGADPAPAAHRAAEPLAPIRVSAPAPPSTATEAVEAPRPQAPEVAPVETRYGPGVELSVPPTRGRYAATALPDSTAELRRESGVGPEIAEVDSSAEPVAARARRSGGGSPRLGTDVWSPLLDDVVGARRSAGPEFGFEERLARAVRGLT